MMGYAFAALLVAAIVATWLSYNKGHTAGVAATVKRMTVLIDQGTERRDTDLDKLNKVPEDKLDDVLKKLCEERKKPGQTCAP